MVNEFDDQSLTIIHRLIFRNKPTGKNRKKVKLAVELNHFINIFCDITTKNLLIIFKRSSENDQHTD